MDRTTTLTTRGARRVALAGALAATGAVAALGAPAGIPSASASASAGPGAEPECSHYQGPGIPPGSGIPPWGFHVYHQTLSNGRTGMAHGWGNIDLSAGTISGHICQYVTKPGRGTRAIAVSLGPRITYHTHEGTMWGYPGNIVISDIRVTASADPTCPVGSTGHVTMYASYNGVRSDSVQFFFRSGCPDERNLYHGPQVNAQVPPL
jgi:hypothetical protein